MEKISRILPSNARTRSAEVAKSQPARPGAPAFGRPMGHVTRAPAQIEDRINLSTAEKAVKAPGTYRPPADLARAKIVEDMANKFFNSPKAEVREHDMAKSEELADLAQDIRDFDPA